MGPRRPSGTATVLFTDLVGSTELMARLGDAAFDELRAEHFARLKGAIAAHGGVEVKNTGDGVLVTFSSAVDALEAAVALQQATEDHRRLVDAPLRIRVGLAIGEVGFEDGDVFGTPVVEAARLVAAARPGQILSTAMVRAMAGTRAAMSFTDLGVLQLKGLPDPIPVCDVAWEPLAQPAPAVPLPTVLGGAGRIFVGRDEELARLRLRWKAAGAGERRLVLLGGEPGIGKTRLATQLARALHAEGALVLAGRCDEDLGVPYQPFVDALRHYTAHAPTPQLGRHPGELARLVPELSQLVPGLDEPLRSDPETERYRLFDSVASWVGDVSAESPVLFIVDDLHWAAKPTLLLLRHVLRSSEPMRVLIVATYRDTDVGRGHPLAELLADVPRLEAAERLPLSGLDVPAVAAFLEEVAGHDLDDEGVELAGAVWRETEGNAFFVSEVLRHLTESGAIERREGRWVLTGDIQDLGIPEGVHDVVGRRLSRLSGEANRVLACASVVGLEFEPKVVELAGGFSEDVVLGALEEAGATRLVTELPGSFPRNRFAHALVRATLYDELSAARRVALHRRVAEAIEVVHRNRLDDQLPALAHHWARASAPAAETAKAVEYATRAGDRALAQLAHDEAVVYYHQALELLELGNSTDDDGRRLELLIALGEAQRRSGDRAHRDTLLLASGLAQDRHDAAALARSALANTRGTLYSVSGAVDHERVRFLEAALASASEADSAMRARLLATLALELTFADERDRRLALSDESVALARRLGDDDTLAHVLIARYAATVAPDTLSERLSDSAELVRVAARIDDPATRTRAFIIRYRLALQTGELEEADRCLGTAEALADELGQPVFQWMTHYLRAARTLIAGDLEESERQARVATEFGLSGGQLDAPWGFTAQLFVIRQEQGRLGEELKSLLEETLGQMAAMGSRLAFMEAANVVVALEVGREEEARTGLARILAGLPSDLYWALAAANCASAAVGLGDTGQAQMLYDLLLGRSDHVVPYPVFPTPSVSHHLGVLAGSLGRWDDAERHFAAAAAEHARIGAPTFLARTRLEWGQTLLARGRPDDIERARSLLALALGAARDLGAAGVERRAALLLAAAG